MWKKVFWHTVLLFVSFSVVTYADEAVNEKPVKIGVLYNITGAQAGLDLPSWQGAQIAEKEINATGGLLGRRLEICFYDGATDSYQVEKETVKLIMDDKVSAIIGFSDSDFALRAGALAQTAQIPFITSGATDASLTRKIGDYFFMAAFSDRAQAGAAAAFVAKDLNSKTVCILKDIRMDYALVLSSSFRKDFEKYNGKGSVLIEDTFESDAHDFSKQIERMRALSKMPDIVYVAAGPQDIVNIIQALRTAGIDTAVIGGDSYDNDDFKQVIAPYIGKGVYYTTHAYLNDAKAVLDKTSREFIGEYMLSFGNKRPEAFASLGYDTVMLVADAIRRCGTDNPKDIREALAKTENFRGISGTITYEGNRHVPKKPVFVMQMNGKKAMLVDIWRVDEQQ